MNMRNIVRTYNYLSPRQKMAVAIAAIVGGGVSYRVKPHPLIQRTPSISLRTAVLVQQKAILLAVEMVVISWVAMAVATP